VVPVPDEDRIIFMYHMVTGRWTVWNISLFLDGAEDMAEKGGSFMDATSLKPDNSSYVLIKQVIRINPEIYKFHFLSDASFKITRKLCEPGRTTNNTVTKMFDIKSGNLLVERCAKIGLIDNVTRKPVPHPDWFVKKYSYLYGSESPPELLRQTIPDPPKNCFQWRTIVRFSDMDSNFHANQSVYVKFCFDCSTTASLSGNLAHFTGDINSYSLFDISIDYLGESFAGDELIIVMWQDHKDVSKLSFSIYKTKDKKQLTYVVCHLGLDQLIVWNPLSKF
jgi:acyl-CoA thioesterase FadM